MIPPYLLRRLGALEAIRIQNTTSPRYKEAFTMCVTIMFLYRHHKGTSTTKQCKNKSSLSQ